MAKAKKNDKNNVSKPKYSRNIKNKTRKTGPKCDQENVLVTNEIEKKILRSGKVLLNTAVTSAMNSKIKEKSILRTRKIKFLLKICQSIQTKKLKKTFEIMRSGNILSKDENASKCFQSIRIRKKVLKVLQRRKKKVVLLS